MIALVMTPPPAHPHDNGEPAHKECAKRTHDFSLDTRFRGYERIKGNVLGQAAYLS